MNKNFRRWIYHAKLDPKVIDSCDFEKYEKEGWADTPAKFAKIVDFGVDESDPAAVQVLGEAIAGVNDRINGQLNLDVMNKAELEAYARKHFKVELDKRRTKAVLVAEVKDLNEV